MHLNTSRGKILFITVSSIIAFLNIFEIVLIVRCKNRKVFDKLLLSLAISDTFVGLSVASLKIYDLTAKGTVSWLRGTDFASIFLLSVVFSMSNLILITADRFLAVKFPIKHRMLTTKRRVNAAIVLLWSLGIVCVAFFCVMQFRWGKDIHLTLNVASGFLLLFGAMMTIMYINIFYLICKRRESNKTGIGEQNKATNRRPALLLKGPNPTERGVFLTGAVVTLSFIICTYPFAISFFLKQSKGEIALLPKVLILLNSLLNPLIYFFKNYSFVLNCRGGSN